MCGIAGIAGLGNTGLAQEKIRKMTDRLRHRGPDADGVFVNEKIALGHRRLSIIDLSEASNQPFLDKTGRFVVVFNGEIYNYQDVKLKLKEYPFKTESDTEVLLAAYEKYGVDCLEMLNGMFAFAIWDKDSEKLFVARDRLGVKPFFYSINDAEIFSFASEIRSLLESGLVPRELSDQALTDYLMYQSVYSPLTIVKNVFQLKAGEYGVFENGRFEKHRYWKIEKTRDFSYISETRIQSEVKRLLQEAIERRMISDVPLGAFLSGGIDSSAVVALMSQVSDRPINTFSVAFDEQEYDESAYAQIIVDKFKTNHTSVKLSPDDFLSELPNALAATDSPSGDGINTYVVSKATRNAGITVALSGLGGDELFAGYEYFKTWLKLKEGKLQNVPQVLRNISGSIISNSKNSKFQRLANILSLTEINIAEVYPILRQVLSPRKVSDLLSRNGFVPEIQKDLRARLPDIEKLPLLSQFSIGELSGFTQNVLLKDTDQFSMASALEVREPFFDYKLVEYVLGIPDEFKYPKYPKSLLVESISPLLPDEVVHRKKMGFVLPWEKWMRNELREFCDKRLRYLGEREILNSEKLLSQWGQFLDNKNGVLWSHLWHLVVLSQWIEDNNF